MTAPQQEPVSIPGYNGTVVFDGRTVAITRTGFLARATIGKGEKRIPLRQITAVQLKPAGPMVNGFIQFSLGGGNEARSRFGAQTTDAARDENSVIFRRPQQPGFEWLRDAIEHALHAPPAPQYQPPAAADPVAQLQQLADLHRGGALSDAEFHTAKQGLLRQLGR